MTTNTLHTDAIAALWELNATRLRAIKDHMPQVERDYATLEQGARLMRRNGTRNIHEAMELECVQRAARARWAETTRNG